MKKWKNNIKRGKNNGSKRKKKEYNLYMIFMKIERKPYNIKSK